MTTAHSITLICAVLLLLVATFPGQKLVIAVIAFGGSVVLVAQLGATMNVFGA